MGITQSKHYKSTNRGDDFYKGEPNEPDDTYVPPRKKIKSDNNENLEIENILPKTFNPSFMPPIESLESDKEKKGIVVTKDDNFFFGKEVFSKEEDLDEIETYIRNSYGKKNPTFSLRDMCVLIDGDLICFVPLSTEHNEFMSYLTPLDRIKVAQYKKSIVYNFLLKLKRFGIILNGPYILYSNRPKIFNYSHRPHQDCIYNLIVRKDISDCITQNMRPDRLADFVFIQYPKRCVSTTFEFEFSGKKKTLRYSVCPDTTFAFKNLSDETTNPPTPYEHSTPYILERETSGDNQQGNTLVAKQSSEVRYLSRDLLQIISSQKLYKYLKLNCTIHVFTETETTELFENLSTLETIPSQTLEEYYNMPRKLREKLFKQCGGTIKTKRRKTKRRRRTKRKIIRK